MTKVVKGIEDNQIISNFRHFSHFSVSFLSYFIEIVKIKSINRHPVVEKASILEENKHQLSWIANF